jgi:hypothetical protein
MGAAAAGRQAGHPLLTAPSGGHRLSTASKCQISGDAPTCAVHPASVLADSEGVCKMMDADASGTDYGGADDGPLLYCGRSSSVGAEADGADHRGLEPCRFWLRGGASLTSWTRRTHSDAGQQIRTAMHLQLQRRSAAWRTRCCHVLLDPLGHGLGAGPPRCVMAGATSISKSCKAKPCAVALFVGDLGAASSRV